MSKQAVNNDIKPGSSKLKIVFIIIEIALIAVLTAVNLVEYILTDATFLFLKLVGLILTLIILLIISLLIKDKTACLVGNSILTFCALAGLVLASVLPSGIRSHSQWKYKYQKAYAYRNRYVTDFFPDSIPKDVDDYYFCHVPGSLQGSGETHLLFTASPDVIKAIENEYTPNATSSFQMTNEDAEHILYNSNGFWIDTEATIYTLSDTGNFNHPHYTKLIISKDHTKLEFFSVA